DFISRYLKGTHRLAVVPYQHDRQSFGSHSPPRGQALSPSTGQGAAGLERRNYAGLRWRAAGRSPLAGGYNRLKGTIRLDGKVRSSRPERQELIKVRGEPPAARCVPQAPDRLLLDLSHPLAGEAHLAPDGLERHRRFLPDAEVQRQHLGLARRQRLERGTDVV